MVAASIIIPVFNRALLTKQCLDTLLSSEVCAEPTEIIVVDDASRDATSELLRRYGDRIRVLTHQRNAGYARACNDGAQLASSRRLVFLNNDTLPRPGWLNALLRYAERHPRAAAVGSRLLFPDNTIQHAGVVICHDRYPRHVYAGFPAGHPAVNKSRQFQVVTAACVLIQRDAFEAVGGFSTEYENGFEDVDLCLRLRDAGWEIHYCHESLLYHYEAATRGGREQEDERNRRRYDERWRGRVRPDEFDFYLDDGLLTITHGSTFPLRWSVSPLLGAVVHDDERERLADELLAIRSLQVYELLKEKLARATIPTILRPHPERQIGIFGTFDVENYGDLLFPLIAEFELRHRLGPFKLRRFSYHDKAAPEWPYDVSSLRDLPAAVGELDGAIIGGGGLVRFDKQVAPDYAPPGPEIHHPTGYWLTPALLALQHGLPLVWNAPGVYGEVPAWARPLIVAALSLSGYVSVRDEPSRQALAPLAGSRQVAVVPDTAFGIARLVDLQEPSAEFARLRTDRGLSGGYIVLQATPLLRDFPRFVRSHDELFGDYRLVLLPVGPGQLESDSVFDHDLPGLVRLPERPNPLLTAEIIAHAEAVVGISLHLSITALAFGVPAFRPDSHAYDKYAALAEFESVHYFDGEYQVGAEWFAARLGRAERSRAVCEALDRLDLHWDRIADVLGDASADRKAARLKGIGGLSQALPGLLEAWAVRHAAALAKRDAAIAERDAAIAGRDRLRLDLDRRLKAARHEAAESVPRIVAIDQQFGGGRNQDRRPETEEAR